VFFLVLQYFLQNSSDNFGLKLSLKFLRTLCCFSGSGGLEFWLYLYSNTPMRATPFLVGMGLGYLMSNPGFVRKARLTTWQVYLGWALNTAMCLAIVFTLAIAYKEDYQDNNLEAAFYGSLHRLGWSIGIAWIIFACSTGHGGKT